MCLHPGGPSPEPGTPSIGLYGGLKVGLTACGEAGYRWSVRSDDKGIVLGSGVDVVWGLNAEEVGVGSEVTVCILFSDLLRTIARVARRGHQGGGSGVMRL